MMNIPNDTGHPWRLHKFLEYAQLAPTVCHPTIIAYSKRAKWDEDTFLTAAFLHCLFYEELTAISTIDKFGLDLLPAIEYWDENKPHTNPDKRRVVTMRLYPDAIKGWIEETDNDPSAWIKQFSTRKELRAGITRIHNIGGFSADLFENCVYNAGYNFGKRYPDWRTTPQLAIGMYYILYKDDRAGEIAKGSPVTKEDENVLDRYFEKLCNAMEKRYPGNPPEVWYTKLCSWANLFRGTRYGGYHHDRQLGNLLLHQKEEPEQEKVWKRIYVLRKQLWPHHLLGELNGWTGIRKERTKLWLERGLTGVEPIS